MKLFLLILGIIILVFLIIFVFCACKVASLCDKEMEKIKDNSINSVLSIMEQIKRDYGIVFGYSDIKELVNSNLS